MHLFQFAFFTAGVLYAIFQEQQLIIYFLLVVAAYMIISAVYPGAKSISNRKKIMLSTWTEPSEGVIQVRVPVRTEKVQAVIDRYAREGKMKLTLTHFVLKGCGVLLNEGKSIQGKLVFGKFVPFKSADASCLVDIDGGKDLALILIKDIDKKGVQNIAEFVREKGQKIKKNSGDAQHKKRTQVADYLPAFMVSILIKVVSFLSSKLGVSIPALGLKKDQFGSCCVTSLGMLGFQDAIAPFSGFMNCPLFVSVNAVVDAPVVEDGKVVVGKVMNVNFIVDHRYIDGGNAKTFMKSFRYVFDNPEKFLKSSDGEVMQKQSIPVVVQEKQKVSVPLQEKQEKVQQQVMKKPEIPVAVVQEQIYEEKVYKEKSD